MAIPYSLIFLQEKLALEPDGKKFQFPITKLEDAQLLFHLLTDGKISDCIPTVGDTWKVKAYLSGNCEIHTYTTDPLHVILYWTYIFKWAS